MLRKPHKYFNCGAIDKLILFNDLTDMDQTIDNELDIYDNKQRFDSRTDTTFADYFINQAMKVLGHDEHSLIENLQEEIQNFDGWRVFMKTLMLVTKTYGAGDIPDIAQAGAAHVPVQQGAVVGGENSGKVRQDKAKSAKEIWQVEANKIWSKNRKLSNLEVAKRIVKKIGGKAETIRKSIKKPLP